MLRAIGVRFTRNNPFLPVCKQSTRRVREQFHLPILAVMMSSLGATWDANGTETVISGLLKFRDLHPFKPAMVTFDRDFQKTLISFDELVTKSQRFAAVLISSGFNPHDVIANTLPPSIERFVTDLGIMMAGCVVVGVKAALSTDDSFFNMLNRCDAKAVVVSPDLGCTEWFQLKDGLLSGSKVGELGLAFKSPAAPGVNTVLVVTRKTGAAEEVADIPKFSSFLARDGREHRVDVKPKPHDPAYIFSTSGSTGVPKLLMRSHGSQWKCCDVASTIADKSMQDAGLREPLVLWNNHSFSFLAGFPLMVVGRGAKLVTLDGLAPPPDDMWAVYWHAMASEGVNAAHLVSLETESLAVSKSEHKYKIPILLSGGMPMTGTFIRTSLDIGQMVVNHYGSAEMASVATTIVASVDDFRPGHVGRPVDGVQVRLVDDDGKVVEENTPGDIQVKSDWLIEDYHDDPEQVLKRKAFTDDGWFRSGDVGCMTSDGDVIVLGRTDDAILYGPFTIFPAKLEALLSTCPGVHEVAVVPVGDDMSHHKLCACVVKSTGDGTLGPEGLLDFARSQQASPPDPYMTVPHYVLFMDAFPRVTNSKVNRRQLAREAERSLKENQQL